MDSQGKFPIGTAGEAEISPARRAMWESEPRGLIFPVKTRIDLAEIGAQPAHMGELAILIQHPKLPVGTSEVWLGRAEQARRIASMLSVRDAVMLDGYAIECEAEAARLIADPALRVAA